MTTAIIGAALLGFGSWMCVKSRTGPQETLGGLLVMIGVVLLLIMAATAIHNRGFGW